MSSDDLSLFSYEILGLVGRQGAGAHDLLRMARRGRMPDWAGESQYYVQPKRLAEPHDGPDQLVLATFGTEVLHEWGGAQRWVRAPVEAVEALRALAARHGGHATLFRGPRAGVEPFQPLPLALMALHRRVKAAFDPHGLFNPGRLYAEF